MQMNRSGFDSMMDGNVSSLQVLTIPTDTLKLPREMSFTDDSVVSVVTYTILFIIAAGGNLAVFITLFRYRHRKSRVNLFIMHLCIADMIVTFIMLPMEIGWHLTVSWRAGDIGCRLLMFFRAFGFYLSSFILIAISLDRYFAIAQPLSLNDASRRGKIMLSLSWIFSFVASAPQSVIFHQEQHPIYRWFTQCVTFNFFPSTTHELAYNLFNVLILYILPLLVIIITYSLIVYEITKKTRESRRQLQQDTGTCKSLTKRGKTLHFSCAKREETQLRRSSMGKIEKARTRTLKMTIVIVTVFIICWTPYFVISAWWWFDKGSAGKIDPKITRALFIFAVSNSCMNPIVYGMFTTVFQREIRRIYTWFTTRITQFILPENIQNETEKMEKPDIEENDMIHTSAKPAGLYKAGIYKTYSFDRQYPRDKDIHTDKHNISRLSYHKSSVSSGSSSKSLKRYNSAFN